MLYLPFEEFVWCRILKSSVNPLFKSQKITVIHASNKSIFKEVYTVALYQLSLNLHYQEVVNILTQVRLTSKVNVYEDCVTHLLCSADIDKISDKGSFSYPNITDYHNRSPPECFSYYFLRNPVFVIRFLFHSLNLNP